MVLANPSERCSAFCLAFCAFCAVAFCAVLHRLFQWVWTHDSSKQCLCISCRLFWWACTHGTSKQCLCISCRLFRWAWNHGTSNQRRRVFCRLFRRAWAHGSSKQRLLPFLHGITHMVCLKRHPFICTRTYIECSLKNRASFFALSVVPHVGCYSHCTSSIAH